MGSSLCIRILDVDPLNIGTRVIYVVNSNVGLAKDFKGFFSVRLTISFRCTSGKDISTISTISTISATENILDVTLTVSVVGKGFDGAIDFGFTVVIIVRTRQNLGTREQVDHCDFVFKPARLSYRLKLIAFIVNHLVFVSADRELFLTASAQLFVSYANAVRLDINRKVAFRYELFAFRVFSLRATFTGA